MRKKITIFLLFLIIAQTAPSFAMVIKKPATDKPYYIPNRWDQEPLYSDRAFGKFTYGCWNFMMGWMAVLKEPYESYTLHDNVILGIGRGIVYGVADMAGGALNAVTFPVTTLKIPLPEGGVDAREF